MTKVIPPFQILATDGKARRGKLYTKHGVINTPVFMPVATQGSVKALTQHCVATGIKTGVLITPCFV